MPETTTKLPIKITAILGALILFAGAGFHMSALGAAKTSLADVEPQFFKHALAGMWVLPSAHWAFIGFLSIGLSRYKSKACAAMLIAFGVWMLMDAFISFAYVGMFIGVYIMSAAGLLLLSSGVMLRKQARAEINA